MSLIAFFMWMTTTSGWSDSPSQFDPFTFALLNDHQDQDCALGFCEALTNIGPPPDTILHLPPPPLPPQFVHLIQNHQLVASNNSLSGACAFCEHFAGVASVQAESSPNEPSLNRTQTDHESWLSLLVASILASSVLGTVFILFLARCRHWKPFQLASCPLMPSKFLTGSVSSNKSPPACRSPSDGCVSPVVNEKSPQCIISNSPCKRSTIIPAKYWRTSRCPIDLHSPTPQTALEQSASTTELEEYTGCGESGSCTSSPVYAELDAHQQITQMLQHQLAQQQQNSHCNQINTTQLGQSIQFGTASVLNAYADTISTAHCPGHARPTCTQIRLSATPTPAPNIHHQQTLQQHQQQPQQLQLQNNAYSVHTYAELPEPVRVNRFGPNTSLLPDVSYDNAAYLPSSTGDHHQYQNRSLRRHRAANLGQLGSTTPLLGNHYGNTMHSQFMTAGRNSNKKQRGGFLLQSNHQQQQQQQSMGGSRLNLNGGGAGGGTMISLRSDSMEAEALDLQPRYVQTSGRGRIVHEVYNDASLGDSSPSINSFRTLSYKEQPKRPLPPVPGVRL